MHTAKRWANARPMPSPPTLRVAEPSTCSKDRKRVPMRSGAMPGPLSRNVDADPVAAALDRVIQLEGDARAAGRELDCVVDQLAHDLEQAHTVEERARQHGAGR